MPIYKYEGKKYNIPEDKVAEFERAFPNATVVMYAGDKTYNIPVSKQQAFKTSFNDASYNPIQASADVEGVKTTQSGAVVVDEPKDSLVQKIGKVMQGVSSPSALTPVNVASPEVPELSQEEKDQRAAMRQRLQEDGTIQRMEDMKKEARRDKIAALGRVMSVAGSPSAFVPNIDSGNWDDVQQGSTDYRQNKLLQEKLDVALDMARAGENQDGLRGVENFGLGLWDSATRLSTWDFGYSDITNTLTLQQIVEKWENDPSSLTATEKKVLDGIGMATAVQELYSDQVGVGYNVGQSLPESAGFMASMALNPASGLGKSLARNAVRTYGRKAVGKIAARRALGDLAETAIMTATTGAGRVAADALERINGSSTYEIGENGVIMYGGQKDQETVGNAVIKAIGSNFIENYSEALGEYLDPLLGMSRKVAAGGLRKMHLDKWADALSDVQPSQMTASIRALREKAKFGGILGEIMEEEVGMALNTLFVGDNQWSDFVDLETQLTTVLSCAIMSGTLNGVEQVSSVAARRRMERNAKNAEQEASYRFSRDKFAPLREAIDQASPEGMVDVLRDVYLSQEYTVGQKRALAEYAAARLQLQYYNAADAKARRQVNKTQQELLDAQEAGLNAQLPQFYSIARAAQGAEEDLLDYEGDYNLIDIIRSCVNKPEEMERILGDLPRSEARLVSNYIYSRARMEGAYQGRSNRAEDYVDDFAYALEPAVVTDAEGNRTITTAIMGDRSVYVLDNNGDLAHIMYPDGSKTLVKASELTNITTSSAEEVIDRYRDMYTFEYNAETENAFEHHPKTQAPQVGLQLQSPEGEVVITAVNDNMVEIVPAVYKDGQVQPKEGAEPRTITVDDAYMWQDSYYQGLDDAAAATASQPTVDNMSEETTENESTPTEAIEQSVSEEVADGQIAETQPTETEGVAPVAPAAPAAPQTARERVPRDGKGNPIYEQTDADTAWDAIVEETDGNVEMAQSVAEQMLANKKAALEKLQKGKAKAGANVAQIIANEKKHQEAIAKAEADVKAWERISRVNTIRQQKAELERAAAEKAEAEQRRAEEARILAEQEEQARIEREQLNGVPDMVDDIPADARARGFRRVNGHKVDRQEIVPSLQGKEVGVKFANDMIANGRVAVIEAETLQPSHLQGQRNPAHFIDEAQPKERNDEASIASARKIASNIRPEEITTSVTAYTGAPTVNMRGEAIQGNSRSDALRVMWAEHPDQAEKYKQYLIDHAEEFGLNAEEVAAMQHPVLVNMLDVSDADAINLGQYVAQDTESGDTERIKPKNVARKMGSDIRSYANILLRSSDEEASFSELVDKNGVEVLKWMNTKGYITPTQYASAFDSKGNMTAEAKNDLRGILYQSIFQGGNTQLEEQFNAMPAKAQKAILATAYRDYDSPESERMIAEIQSSIRAYYALSHDRAFVDAKNYAEAKEAMLVWSRQYQMDDVTGESFLPSENFSNFALELAVRYKGNTQSATQNLFNELFDLIQGTKEASLFEEADSRPRTLAEAIKETLNIDYNGQNGSNALVGDDTSSQEGRQGSTGDSTSGELPQNNESAADDRGRAAGDSDTRAEETGGVAQVEEPSDDYILNEGESHSIDQSTISQLKNWQRTFRANLAIIDRVEKSGGLTEELIARRKKDTAWLKAVEESLARKEKIKAKNKWGVKSGNHPVPLGTVKKMFAEWNENADIQALFDRVFGTFEKLGVNITFEDNIGSGKTQGWFAIAENRVKLPTHMIYSNRLGNQSKASVMVHEMIHGVTQYVLWAANLSEDSRRKKGITLSDGMITAAEQLNEIYDIIKKDKRFKGQYGLEDVHEMVSELAEPKFRALLKETTIWDRIVEAIRNILGLEVENNALDGASKALDYIIDNYDANLYKKVSNIANRKATANVFDIAEDVLAERELRAKPMVISKADDNIRFREKDNQKKPLSLQKPSAIVEKISECFYDDASRADRIAMVEYLQQSEEGREVIERLYKHRGSGWARQAVNAAMVRIALNDLINGREPSVQSMLTRGAEHKVVSYIRRMGAEGVWRYLEEKDFLSEAAKPLVNINGSFLSCNPSAECAKYCYATKGHYTYAGSSVKSELIYWAVTTDPNRVADRIYREYQALRESAQSKALRLFDKGDLDGAWIPMIEELNRRGIVTQIFSKRSEVLQMVDDTQNVVMLSIDHSNADMLDQYPTMPIAFVYRGRQDMELLEQCKERFLQYGGVILPVKVGQKVLSKEELEALPSWTRPYQCPIDNGTKQIVNKENPERSWNCTKCDRNGGVGCFFKRTAKQLKDNRNESKRDGLVSRTDRDGERTSTRNEEGGIGGASTLHDANGGLGESEIRGGILQTLRDGGIPDAYITPELVEALARRIRGRNEDGARGWNAGGAESVDAQSSSTLGREGSKGNRPERASGIDEQTDIRFRDGAPFFSNAEHAVENIKQNKATPEQWLAMIKKDGGLKAGEDKWMGLSDWLNEQKAQGVKTLTKDEVLAFIRENQIEIEEVNYEEGVEDARYDAEEAIRENLQELFDMKVDEVRDENPEQIYMSDIYEEAFERVCAEVGYNKDDAPFVYTNATITLRWYPDVTTDELLTLSRRLGFSYEGSLYIPNAEQINSTRISLTTSGLSNKKEIAFVVPTIEPWNKNDEIHFGDAGDGRAVAWVRFGDTIDEDGNWVLVIDEVQSRRHDEGRAKGYQSKEKGELLAERERLYGKMYSEGLTEEEFNRRNEINARLEELGEGRIPDAPFDKNYYELVMKRMLRYAAENGFDKVAWTKGAQQAGRYSLSDTVEEVSSKEQGDGLLVRLDMRNNSPIIMPVSNDGIVDAKHPIYGGRKLADVVGQEDARIILDAREIAYSTSKVLGGEDRNALYDEMIPRFMNKYTKKWGTKVGEVTLPNVEEAGRTMWSVDVTPEMRESVMQGQPMFREGMGAISDREVSYENDPIAKFQGKPRYYGKRAAAFAERERRRMENAAKEAAEMLGIEAEIVTDASTLQGRKAKAKGWYDIINKKVVVVVPNHVSMGDAVRTVLHEGIAHHGLRELFGAGFDAMLDNIYNNVAPELKARIDAIAERTGVSTQVATEEYLASLAETTNFEEAQRRGWWQQIKRFFVDMLNKLAMPGLNFKEELTDNELRYLLWRSYKNLVEPNSYAKPLGFAEDVVKQKELKVGEYAEKAPATPMAAETSEAEEWAAVTMQRIEELEAQAAQLENEIADMEAERDADDESRYDVWEQQLDPLRAQLEDVYTEIEGLYNLEAEDADIADYEAWREAEKQRKLYQKRIDNAYLKAVREGDWEEATDLFRQYVLSKAEDEGIVPMDYGVGYRGGAHSSIAKKVKEENPDAIAEAAYQMSIRIPKGSILVPMPSRTGNATYTVKLAEAIAKATDSEVRDVLKGKARMSVYEAKQKGIKMTPEDLGMYTTEELPKGKNIVIIDNVIDKGTTALAAASAVKGASVVAYAYTLGDKQRVATLKLAEPVTYDDNKRIIPLSQRFNKETDDIRYRLVEDQAEIDRLESEPTIKAYRAMQVINGELYPPMSAVVDGKLREPIALGQWERSEERPELADDDGNFKLNKGNKKSPVPARYNPYFHSSATPLNDQFAEAQDRPNLVTVEVEIPQSEADGTSGYKAEKAKDAVGTHQWKAGVIQGQISGTRTLYLSRWDKPVRIVPDSEVAGVIAKMLEGTGIVMPSNVVTPSLRAELEKLGVPFVETTNRGKLAEGEHKGEGYGKVYGKKSTKKSKKNAEIIAEVERESAALGVPVRIARSVDELPDADTRKRAVDGQLKGYFDPRTGEVVLYEPNTDDANDAKRTVLHEIVGHKGLRQLIGEQRYDKAMLQLMYMLPADVRDAVLRRAERHGWNAAIAMDEYLAEQAERDVQPTWWGKVNSKIRAILRNIGFNVMLTDADVTYLLWRSRKKLQGDSLNDMAVNAILKQAARKSAEAEAWNEQAFKDAEMRDFESNALPSIRHRMGADTNDYEKAVRTLGFKQAESWQDSMRSLKVFMDVVSKESGKKIDDFENAYMYENAMSSANLMEMQMFRHDVYGRLLKAINELMESGAKYEEIVDYMMAKHGLERNEKMARKRAEKEADGDAAKEAELYAKYREEDLSGLTALTGVDNVADAEAAAMQMIADFEAKHNTDLLWNETRACTQTILNISHDAGILSDEVYGELWNQYEYYIPLRGFDETTAEEVYTYVGDNKSPYNAPIKTAKGRKSKADDPIATIATMAESAIVEANRNRLKQRFLYMVERHRTELASVSSVWVEKDPITGDCVARFANIPNDATPEEAAQAQKAFEENMEQLHQQEPDRYYKASDKPNIPYRVEKKANEHEHQIIVKRNGKDVVITINGDPRVAQAINGQTNPEAVEGFSKYAGNVNRFLSANFTTRNPAFVVSNFVRDGFYTNSMVWVKENPAYAWKYNQNWAKATKLLPSLVRKYKRYEKGDKSALDMSDPVERAFYEFMINGGETGYTVINSVEDYKGIVAGDLKTMQGGVVGNTKKAVQAVGEVLDTFGRWAEDTSRFAAYMTSRQLGRTITKSVWDAKEISVNFNKKGSGRKMTQHDKGLNSLFGWMSQQGRNLYVFWNAGMQGMFNFGKAAKEHPGKIAGLAGAYFGLGMAIAAIFGGNDDDDDYWNLPEYVRRNNICFKIGKGKYATLPLPIELRAIYGMGELAMSWIAGKEDPEKVGMKVVQQVSQVMPIDMMAEGGGAMAFIPSWGKPLVEVYENTDWTGMPIYRGRTEYNKHEPQWMLAFNSTSPEFVAASRAINEATNENLPSGKENKYDRGWADIEYLNNPAAWEHVVEGYLGGLATMFNQTKKSVMSLWNKDLREVRNVPIISRFVKSSQGKNETYSIRNDWYESKEYIDKMKYQLGKFRKDTNKIDPSLTKKQVDEVMSARDDVEDMYNELIGDWNDMNYQYEQMKDEYKTNPSDSLQFEINELMKEMVNVVDNYRQ